jgi:hypothetical protein
MFKWLSRLFGGERSSKSLQSGSTGKGEPLRFRVSSSVPNTFSTDELRCCVVIGFEVAKSAGDFDHQMDAMVAAGIPENLAALTINMIPIIAGRRFLAESGPMPKVSDYYNLIDEHEVSHQVPLASCGVCREIQAKLESVDPLTVMTIGMGSCEFLAFNDGLNRLGPDATEADVGKIEIAPPLMVGDLVKMDD